MPFIGLAHKDQPLLCDLSPSTETKGEDVEDGRTTSWEELGSLNHSLEETHPLADQEHLSGTLLSGK